MTLSDFQIKIKSEYAELVRPLSSKEYQELKESIKEKGLHLPIIINQENTILDGHHRYQICNELGIDPKYEIKIFENRLEELDFVSDINEKRRQLNEFERIEQVLKTDFVKEKEKSRLRQIELAGIRSTNTLAQNDAKVQIYIEKGKTSEKIAKKAKSDATQVERVQTILKYGTEEQLKRLREGKTTISKENNFIRRDLRNKKFLADIQKCISLSKNTSKCTLLLGDFREKAKQLEDNPIDIIVTDPPYADTPENLALWEGLAKLAMRVLKPGGIIAALTGQIIIHKVHRIFEDSGLNWWWGITVKHGGHTQIIHSRNMIADKKDFVIYYKGEKINQKVMLGSPVHDLINSSPPDKILHEWEQSTIEFEYIIKKYVAENQIVLDPFMDSGTTGIAALKLNRKFMGIEINPVTFERAKARISKELSEAKGEDKTL